MPARNGNLKILKSRLPFFRGRCPLHPRSCGGLLLLRRALAPAEGFSSCEGLQGPQLGFVAYPDILTKVCYNSANFIKLFLLLKYIFNGTFKLSKLHEQSISQISKSATNNYQKKSTKSYFTKLMKFKKKKLNS